MADSTTGLHVKSLSTETVRAKLVDTGGTNEAAISAAGRVSVDGSGVTQPVSGTVAVSSITTSVTPGTSAAHLGKAEDAVAADGDTGVLALAVRRDSASSGVSADGDYAALSVDSSGALRVTGGSGGTQYVGDAAATATPTGTIAMGLANAAAPTDVSANNDAVAQWMLRNGSAVVNLASGGTLLVGGNGTAATALRVTIASDSTGVIGVTDNGGSLTVDGTVAVSGTVTTTAVGTVAHDAVGTGANPLLVGGYASAAAPTDVSADGDAVRSWYLRNGAQAVNLTAAGTLIAAGNGTNGTALRVTIASDSTGTVAATQSGTWNITNISGTVSLPTGAATAANQTNVQIVDNAGFTDGTTTVMMGGYIFDDVAGTALTENDAAAARIDSKRAQVFVGEDASTRGQKWAISAAGALAGNITQVGGTTVVTGGTAGSLGVGGTVAHDAAGTGVNPALIGAYASAAAPTDVSADGDAVRVWALRNGSQVVNLAAAGTLVTFGQKTMANAFSVSIASDQSNLPSNITQIGGATPGATAYLPARLTDGTAYYTNTGQTAGTASFTRITDATNTAAVIATINSLKEDISSIAGAVPSATNPLPVRLTDGSSFYSSASAAPTTPTYSTVTSASLGAGSSTDLDFTAISGGTTGYLMGVDVSSAVPLKVEIKTVNSGTPTTRVVMFTQNGDNLSWRAPFKTFITQAGGATSRFRATVTNRDNAQASDIYGTAFWDQF